MTWRGHGRLGGQREEGVLQEDHQADGDGDDPLGWIDETGRMVVRQEREPR